MSAAANYNTTTTSTTTCNNVTNPEKAPPKPGTGTWPFLRASVLFAILLSQYSLLLMDGVLLAEKEEESEVHYESVVNNAYNETQDQPQQQPQQQQQQQQQQGGKKYMVNCHPDLWRHFIRPELYHIFGGLKDEYGWEEITPDEAAVAFHNTALNSSSLGNNGLRVDVVMVCENNVRFSIDKYSTYESFQRMNLEAVRRDSPHTQIAIYNDDTHIFSQYTTEQMSYLLQHTDAILSTYAYLLKDHWNRWGANVTNSTQSHPSYIWIPHSAQPVFTDLPFNPNPIHNIFLSGSSFSLLYPLRNYINLKHARRPGFVSRKHPGYEAHSMNQTEEYAKMMHQSISGVSTTMSIRRLVAKTFEIPATGALLLLNLDLEPLLKVLGFRNRHNYVGMLDNKPDLAIEWVLDRNHTTTTQHRAEMDQIRSKGRDLIHQQHTTAHRSQQIDDYFTRGGKIAYHYSNAMLNLKAMPCPMAGFGLEKTCLRQHKKLKLWKGFLPKGINTTAPVFNVTGLLN